MSGFRILKKHRMPLEWQPISNDADRMENTLCGIIVNFLSNMFEYFAAG
jgi:hypothetical protein